MKQILLSLLALIAINVTACARSNGKTLIAYVSMTGTTEKAAKTLASVTGGELYEIVPDKRYSSADLDWRNENSRCYVEMHNLKFRPALKATKENIADYDVIYLGFPIWWNIPPTIINTFIEAHNLKGKTIIPFATSGGSSIDNSVKELKAAYPDINWAEGRILNGAGAEEIRKWTEQIHN